MAKRSKASTFPTDDHDHDRCQGAALGRATQLCEARGARLTPLRRRVLELVWSSHRPIGAYEILDTLRNERQGAAPPTVYRALDFLLEQGLVHRVASLNGFVGCAAPEAPHAVQFLICRSCGQAAELSDPRIDDAIRDGATKAGFAAGRRTIEVEGLCLHCRDRGKPGADARHG
jgi:Fur family zinc uptake transcriptional regulator